MVIGTPFEVSKEVYDRAKAMYADEGRNTPYDGYYYMTVEDRIELFDVTIRLGYGLYNCRVHEEDGKYICTWMRGGSCD